MIPLGFRSYTVVPKEGWMVREGNDGTSFSRNAGRGSDPIVKRLHRLNSLHSCATIYRRWVTRKHSFPGRHRMAVFQKAMAPAVGRSSEIDRSGKPSRGLPLRRAAVVQR